MVDNDRFLLDALRLRIETSGIANRVDVAFDEAGALAIAGNHKHDLILLDWWLGTESASRCFQQLRALNSTALLIVMSGDDRPERIADAIQAGAAGFLRKNAADFDTLRQAIDVVIEGGTYLPGPVRAGGLPSPSVRLPATDLASCFPQLTSRQIEVFRLLFRGAPNKIIARELGIEVATVKQHLEDLYRRLDVGSRGEALALAVRRGVRVD